MSELVARTEVPRATIHSYVRRGLLPAPEKAARNRFLYDARHVRAVELIRLLRERRGLSLDDVAAVLPELLGEDADQAFHPDMLENALGLRLEQAGRRSPRDRLVRAGQELLRQRGLADTNIEELCRHAGMAKGSFYQHFSAKEELLFAAAGAVVEDALADLEVVTDAAGRLDRDATAASLAAALGDRLPLLLELTNGALRRLEGYPQALASLRGRMVKGLREAAADAGDDLDDREALRLSREAVADVIRSALHAVATGAEDEVPGA